MVGHTTIIRAVAKASGRSHKPYEISKVNGRDKIRCFESKKFNFFFSLQAARMAAHAGVSPQPPIPAPTGPIMTAMQINATPVMQPHMQPQIHHVQATPNPMFDQMAFAMKAAAAEEESAEAKLEKKRKQEAEKKKKEEEEKAKQQAAKQQDKSRPISSTPIAGTPW